MDRKEAISRIKNGLQKRSGKAWSVTGGRGTAWGWLTIDAPPARRTWTTRDGSEWYDTGEPGHHASPEERQELNELLGLTGMAHHQGVDVPASGGFWEEYIARAEGRTPERYGQVYWD